KYLSSDHDPLYRFHQWEANLRILDVTEIKTVPYVPWSHPFVERLIGTIRRECLDRLLFWTAADLEGETPGRDIGVPGCEPQILSLAATLSRAVSNTDSGVSANSPSTRLSFWLHENPGSKGALTTVSLANTLSWLVPDANCCVSTNSPGTGLTSKLVRFCRSV